MERLVPMWVVGPAVVAVAAEACVTAAGGWPEVVLTCLASRACEIISGYSRKGRTDTDVSEKVERTRAATQLRQLELLGGTVGQHDTTLLIRNLPASLDHGQLEEKDIQLTSESLIRLESNNSTMRKAGPGQQQEGRYPH